MNALVSALGQSVTDAVQPLTGGASVTPAQQLRGLLEAGLVGAVVPNGMGLKGAALTSAITAGLESLLRGETPRQTVTNMAVGGAAGAVLRGFLQLLGRGGPPQLQTEGGTPPSLTEEPGITPRARSKEGSTPHAIQGEEPRAAKPETAGTQPKVHGGVTHKPEAIKKRQDFINDFIRENPFSQSPLAALDPSQFDNAFGSIVNTHRAALNHAAKLPGFVESAKSYPEYAEAMVRDRWFGFIDLKVNQNDPGGLIGVAERVFRNNLSEISIPTAKGSVPAYLQTTFSPHHKQPRLYVHPTPAHGGDSEFSTGKTYVSPNGTYFSR